MIDDGTTSADVNLLATDAEGLGYLGDREAVALDGEYCVIALFHLAELIEHSATSQRVSAQIGGTRCRASPEHVS
ncbi:MAG: hypothetical protein WB770_02830 [Acidimicrobiales bacterium]